MLITDDMCISIVARRKLSQLLRHLSYHLISEMNVQ